MLQFVYGWAETWGLQVIEVDWTLPVHVGHMVWTLCLSWSLHPAHHCMSLEKKERKCEPKKEFVREI